jgi:hypothetical protein
MFKQQQYEYFGKARVLGTRSLAVVEPIIEDMISHKPVAVAPPKYLPGQRLLKKINKERKPKMASLDKSIDSVLRALKLSDY